MDGVGRAVDPAQHDSDEDDFEPAREYDSSDSDDGNDGDTSMGGDDQPMDDQRFAQITGTLLDMLPAPPTRQLKETSEQLALLLDFCQQRETPEGELVDKLSQVVRSLSTPDEVASLVEEALENLAERSPQDPSKAKKLFKSVKRSIMSTKHLEQQDKPESRFRSRSMVASYPDLRLSEYVFSFGGRGALLPLNKSTEHLVAVQNVGAKKAEFKISLLQPAGDGYTVNFEPASGSVKRGHSADIVVTLVFTKRSVHASLLVMIEVVGGHRILASLEARSQPAVFGVDPVLLPSIAPAQLVRHSAMREPASSEHLTQLGRPVPEFLVAMQQLFLDEGGLGQDGVFRHAANEQALARSKQDFNCARDGGKDGAEKIDIHTIATLIKVWFRELPVSLLSTVPVETMMGCDSEEAVLAAFRQIPEPQASLLTYLLDLLVHVAMQAATNRMNAKNLAIVFGPNLLVTDDSAHEAPMQTLVMSQKSVYFMERLIEWRMQNGYGVDPADCKSPSSRSLFDQGRAIYRTDRRDPGGLPDYHDVA